MNRWTLCQRLFLYLFLLELTLISHHFLCLLLDDQLYLSPLKDDIQVGDVMTYSGNAHN
jgi:hypothetical protein